ncbi:MAG: ABC transporter substrate-binding protein [Candidatus Reconcilbacillus cellulovorans]|uniref:ABC transporter substrate-binding protein n=1 Tax=Candidatus Reconcilbacillus cellulovorans TaxID=1906605 RepID=A0A2A6DXP1_9BACL|nr:MAG: ABC transporter substrate-binding protein [Candidatus Reconcilbacillus cellulovorans]
MSKRKTLATLSAALLLAASLAGCGGGSKSSNSDTGSAGQSPAASSTSSGGTSGEKATIKLMHLWPEGSSAQHYKLVNQIIDEYEKAHPNVDVQVEVLENEQYKNKLKVLSASNALPDVGMTWAAGFLEPYAKGKLFTPLDDVLADGLKDKFVPGTVEAYQFDGKTYALPIELNICPIYYNKEIFAKYNLNPPQTYDDFLNIVKTLVQNGVAPIALGNKDRWTGSMWFMYLANRIGGDALNKAIARQGSFEDPSIVQAAQRVQELVDLQAFIKGFNGLSNDEAKSEFMSGKAAMYLMGTWELPNYTTNPETPEDFKKKVGFFKFPTVAGGKGNVNDWVGGPGVGLFVAENSKVKEQAKDFVKFFVQKWGEQSVTGPGVIPATKVDTSGTNLPQLYKDLLNELNNAHSLILYADVQMKPAAADVHLNQIQALFGKATTPEDFAKKQEEALKQAASS